ncbi:uncharacterized protein LOC143596658 isoform X2 [Bidens hawaiensis]|uniref:uncharacterized protein LOC143596658 isoform X2 n=1 Tax=Bidens hawaiensis TaxID=980011 RepID=UPI00404B7D43
MESLTLMESTDCKETSNIKSDSFKVDMEPFSHLINNHTYDSRSNLPRSLSKKGGEEKKKMMSDPNIDNERDAIYSLKGIMSETPIPASIGTIEPQSHHQISIITSAGTPTKGKLIGKRSSSFRHASIINPTRIVFFFATLSSMGTILLIYFTLSMAKYNVDKSYSID